MIFQGIKALSSHTIACHVADKCQTMKTRTVLRKVTSEVLPEAEGAVACRVVGVEPRSCQVAELVDDVVSKLLGEGEGEVVGGRVEEERKENIWVGAGHCC